MPEPSAMAQSQTLPAGPDLLRFWHPGMQQALFRNLLKAFSYPGESVWLADTDGAVAILATLVDAETTLADPHQLLSDRYQAIPAHQDWRPGWVLAQRTK